MSHHPNDPKPGDPYHHAVHDVGDILVSNYKRPEDRMVIMITNIIPDDSPNPVQDTYEIMYLEHPHMSKVEPFFQADYQVPASLLEYHFTKDK